MSEFFTDLPRLESEIDWGVMRTNYWRDDSQDPNRKWKRQAEFLVHETVPWTAIHSIGVIDHDVRRQVELILREAVHKPEIAVASGWYY